MSFTKRQLEKKDEYYRIAYDSMIEMGAIATCEFHDDFYYKTDELEKQTIYAIATNKLKEYAKNNNEENSIDYKLFHSTIDQILSEGAYSSCDCPWCAKLEKE